MSRYVELKIQNNIGNALILKSIDLEHGKFISEPPKKIESDGVFSCNHRSGAMIGPKGTVTYKVEDTNVELKFHFNHPWGNKPSAYRITQNPDNSFYTKIDGDWTTHEQYIEYILYSK
tara:strand:+ start:264 stop:617 length:354 start_codon:yes stop_codon:yes gene_type:complete